MLLSEVQKRQKIVHRVRLDLTHVYDTLCLLLGTEDTASEIASMRGYTDSRMIRLLESKKIVKLPAFSDIQLLMRTRGFQFTINDYRLMGLIGDDGGYWLQDRYAIPLRSFDGYVIALVCWLPDNRKYITTGTLGFTSASTFFNMESYAKAAQFADGKTRVFVVEGIFDALSIESLGYCCFGNEGLALSAVKKEMLSRFDNVYFIPDNDNPGRKSNKYLTQFSSHHWDTPNGHLIRLTGAVKDMDDFVKRYSPANLNSLLTDSPYIKLEAK